MGMMPSSSRLEIPGDVDDQAGQASDDFQVNSHCDSVHDQTISCTDLYNTYLTIPSGDIFPEMTFPTPLFDTVERTCNIVESVKQNQKRPGKRSSEEAFSNDQEDSDGLRSKQKTKTDADNGGTPHPQFACPFQKSDPLRHHECLKYALNRIKDVKQHLYRRHRQPDYYCARCFQVFKTAQLRDDHARIKNCDNKEAPSFEGISEVQRNRLNKSSSRGIDRQDQWFEMWAIVFPTKTRPSSAWVGSHMEEMVSLLRSLWSNRNSSILAEAEKRQERPLDRANLEVVMETMFDSLEYEVSISSGKQGATNCPQNQHNLTPPSKLVNGSPQFFFAEPEPDEFLSGISEPGVEFPRGFVFGQQ